MRAPCVLAVDDEPEILALIEAALGNEGFTIVTAGSVSEFWLRKAECTPDIYLVDVALPDGSGFNLVKEIRRLSSGGILVLSGRSSETDHVVGLEIGADDYITKPFRLRELAARVNAVLRRTGGTGLGPGTALSQHDPPQTLLFDFAFDGYRLSLQSRQLWGPGSVEIPLTTAEFDLLVALVTRRNQVLTRDQIMTAIKGREWESYDRAVDGLVSRLRKKIPTHGDVSPYIRTVHGVGYSFVA